jgi:exosortase
LWLQYIIMKMAISMSSKNLSAWSRWIALGTGLAVLVVLFALWPYQSWSFGVRGNVLVDWVRIVRLGAGGEWEFCLLVPVIVAFLVYRERLRMNNLPLRGQWSGALLMALGALLYAAGYKVDTGYLGYAALQLILAGLILLLAGLPWWKVLFFPWLFLFFAWPLFPLDNLLAARLKMPTAQVAGILLQWCGVDTVRDGSVLDSAADAILGLPQGARFRLEVSNSCSGMRSLYTLLMVAALYGYLALTRTAPRLLIFFSAIPLAVAGNVVRLLMLALGSIWFGQKFAIGTQIAGHFEESTYHLLCGFAVFGVALVGMFALASTLEGWNWKGVKLFDSPAKREESPAASDLQLSALLARCAAAIALGLAAIALCMLTPARVIFAEPGLRAELPAVVGDFQSLQQGMTSKERSNFDETVQLERRIYASPQGRQIMGTVVLAGSQKKTLHPPEVCLPDAGWVIIDSTQIPLLLDNGRTIEVSLMRIFRDLEDSPGHRVRIKGLNIYWYEGAHGTSTPSLYVTDVISYRDAILRNLNHRWGMASFFLPMIQSEPGKGNVMDELIAMEELRKFVAKVAPQFLDNPK